MRSARLGIPIRLLFLPAWGAVLLFSLAGCDGSPGIEPGPHYLAALRSAAADLQQVGFQGQALGLLEEACLHAPTLAAVEEIVDGYVKNLREGDAAACLERIFPSERS
ncbi:MAG: hypothetical protein KJ645_00210, partial [Planctomycetes bacterium]|nr:hypothetical protein [Planctomycetota bacterium]